MQLSQQLHEYISACFTGLWVESHEHDEALGEIAQLCRHQEWRLATWDIDQGLRVTGQETSAEAATDPLAAIRSLPSLANAHGSAVLVLVNFHRFLGSAEVIQALTKQINAGKQNRCFVVVLSPVVQIPTELEKLFIVLDHELPSRTQLQEIAQGVATEDGELPSGSELNSVLDSAAGLTRYEAEGAFSLSVVRHGRITPPAVWQLKGQMLKKSGLLSLHQGSESFRQLGGLDNLKAFCLRAMRKQGQANARCRPRGVMLLSPSGCGKSQFCKALGNETGRPTLVLDVGTLLGSLVGQSEQNVRHALRIADAMAPCVLFIDEVEKALAGVAASGQTDSGVSARLFGSLLTWLNDHTSDVFVVCTSNDIAKLPPEFARAERFDGVFFIDLPTPEQRQEIWKIYRDDFGLDQQQVQPKDDNWTGAEIKACCRLAALLDVSLLHAAQNIVPIAVTAGDAVERLRSWASARCLAADHPGPYWSASKPRRRRSIQQEPSSN